MTQQPGQKASARAQPIAPEHALQRASFDAEDARRPRDVAAGLLQHVGKVAPFDLFESRRALEERGIERAAKLGREILRGQYLAARQRDGALDAMLELADVPGP